MPQRIPPDHGYTSKNITKLTPREHVRKRPGMYIGGTDSRALHHMVWAGMDYMVEEAVEGYSDHIRIMIEDDNFITIENDGLGMSAEETPSITAIMTEFAYRRPIAGHYYGVQGGLHGISFEIVNMLSESFTFETRFNNGLWKQSYTQGIPTAEIIRERDLHPTEHNGITMRFRPDYTIFDDGDFDFEVIAERCQALAHLIPKVKFPVDDRRENGRCELFYSDNGISDWVEQLAQNPIHEVVTIKQFTEVGDKKHCVGIDLAFQFTANTTTIEHSFINSIASPDGGSHIEGLHMGILEAIFPDKNNRPKWKNLNTGLVAVVHALHPDPQFKGRIKMELLNPEVTGVTKTAIKQAFEQYPDALKSIRAHLNI